MGHPSDGEPGVEVDVEVEVEVDVDVEELLGLATELAVEAGVLLADALDDPRRSVGTKSSATDMVTEMDRAADRLIVDRIRAARPHDGVWSEEGGREPGTSGLTWLVDPLDGTTNYLYRRPPFVVSIAVLAGAGALVGVVHEPLAGETFTAVRGGGARRNGRPVAPADTRDVSTALVATGFAYDPALRAVQGEAVARLLPRVRDIRRSGTAAWDLCSVACGRADAFYESGLAPWDHAAGALVASEAGAVVSGFDGGPPSAEGVLAVAPGLAGTFPRLLAEARGTAPGT